MGKTRIVTHFTDSQGLAGITRLNPENLLVGEVVFLNTIRFGSGKSTTFARDKGDIFLTELASNVSAGQLMLIGVFGDKQQFAISFAVADAFDSGVRVEAGHTDRSIFIIPANAIIRGMIKVLKRF